MKKVLISIVVVVLLFVGLVLTQPSAYRVERSIEIAAPPGAVFAIVGDFNRFAEFSPWDALDPNMKKTIKGSGKGATYHWSGNDEVGEGVQTVVAYEPPKKVVLELKFIRPFEDQSIVGYDVVPSGAGTKVTWWMDGKNNFMSKAMSLFMDFEEMIGADYEKGLAKLKPIAEADAKKAAAAAKPAEPPSDAAQEAPAPADAPAPDAPAPG